MGKILYHGNRKKEKGLTLVEVVVSLGLLVIVSIATASVAVFSSTSTKNNSVKRFFANEINNIAILYLSYDEVDFVEAIQFSMDITLTGYDDVTVYYDGKYQLLDSDENYKYKIDFDFTGNTDLTISSFNNQNKAIYSRSVKK